MFITIFIPNRSSDQIKISTLADTKVKIFCNIFTITAYHIDRKTLKYKNNVN